MIFTIGISFIAFMFLYLGFKIDDKHFVVRFFCVAFSLISLIILNGHLVTTQENYYCDIVKMNETVTGNITTYNYDKICYPSSSSSGLIQFKNITWFNYIIMTYIFGFSIYYMIIWLQEKYGKKEE